MLIKDIFNKYRFDTNSDRIGPDIPFTHWKLYFPNTMYRLCKKKFQKFYRSSQIRPGAYIVGCSKICIGENVVIRPGSRLFADDLILSTTIIIEDNVMLGSGVSIYISNHRFDRSDIDLIEQGHYPAQPVLLKKGCWIGANSIILPGVTIGYNSVIAAGSVVTKSIPDRVIAAGNPAIILRQL